MTEASTVIDTPEGRIVAKKCGVKFKLIARSPLIKKRVTAISPGKSRCIVENRGSSEKASVGIQLCHSFARRNSLKGDVMSSVEYCWGMERGSLNLDSRWNCFYTGSDFHALYDEGLWCFMPSLETLKKYEKAMGEDDFDYGVRLNRAMQMDDLEIEGTSEQEFYTYRFLALSPKMKEKSIQLYNAGELTRDVDLRTHLFPFDTPILDIKSHLHPKFVILSLGEQLSHSSHVIDDFCQQKHVKAFSAELSLVEKMYHRWTTNLSPEQNNNPDFIHFTPLEDVYVSGTSKDQMSFSGSSSKATDPEVEDMGSSGPRRSVRLSKQKEASDERRSSAATGARTTRGAQRSRSPPRRIATELLVAEEESGEVGDGGDKGDMSSSEAEDYESEGEDEDEDECEGGGGNNKDEKNEQKRPALHSPSITPPSSPTTGSKKRIRV